jgi:hypothetical protein
MGCSIRARISFPRFSIPPVPALRRMTNSVALKRPAALEAGGQSL